MCGKAGALTACERLCAGTPPSNGSARVCRAQAAAGCSSAVVAESVCVADKPRSQACVRCSGLRAEGLGLGMTAERDGDYREWVVAVFDTFAAATCALGVRERSGVACLYLFGRRLLDEASEPGGWAGNAWGVTAGCPVWMVSWL